MTLIDSIKKDPVMGSTRAISMLTDLTLTQYGMKNSETFNTAYNRISKEITKIMMSHESITKRFMAVIDYSEYGEDSSEVSYEGYCEYPNEKYIMVDLMELHKKYNELRVFDELGAVKLGTAETKPAEQSNSATNITDLVERVCRAVTNIVARDDLLKSDTVKSIIAEELNQVSDESIRAELPKIQSQLHNLLSHKIAKGRISTVIDKKLESAICLSDTVKDNVRHSDGPKYYKMLANFDLSKIDRNHVVDVFIKYRNSTVQE